METFKFYLMAKLIFSRGSLKLYRYVIPFPEFVYYLSRLGKSI